ncbi:MAG: hypothetical protein IJX51_01010 [Clostridia bacterium]|nr:hypothetical protein [Clostridia bacterium]
MNNEQLSMFEEEKTYVLMSLREEFFNEMKSGKKIYEFRKQYCKKPTIAYIYISKKTKAIKGIVEFGEPIFGTSEEIGTLSEKCNPGSYHNIIKYLDKGKGCALPILKVYEISEVSLELLRSKFPGFVAPQSYYLLNKKTDLLSFLLSLNKNC